MSPKVLQIVELFEQLTVAERREMDEATAEIVGGWCPWCLEDLPEEEDEHPCFQDDEKHRRLSEGIESVVQDIVSTPNAKRFDS